MPRNTIFLLLLLITGSATWAQQHDARMRRLQAKFESFEYKDVILISDSILVDKALINSSELTEVYRMKAIAQYSVWDEESASRSFRELLKINKTYRIDEMKTSPKILALFNKTKLEFLSDQVTGEKPAGKDSVRIVTQIVRDTTKVFIKEPDYNFLRSFVFPGWGHLAKNSDLKGMVITGAAAAAAVSAVYFIFDCSSKESRYLNEVDRAKISLQYDAYNKAYGLRNFSLALYGAIWVFAQLDYLGWNPLLPSQSGPIENFRLSTRQNGLTTFSFRFSL
ncbi:MAG: hypothetical protein HYV28_20290 [Ignavibacteriales bacterium]|nr:hypothetical protein [Ignavibacteriales bacterium]